MCEASSFLNHPEVKGVDDAMSGTHAACMLGVREGIGDPPRRDRTPGRLTDDLDATSSKIASKRHTCHAKNPTDELSNRAIA